MREARARQDERGHAAVVLMLAVLALVVMFGAALHADSVTATVTEAKRAAEAQARLNATGACRDADEWLEGEIGPALEEILRQLAESRASMGTPGLTTLTFPTYTRRFVATGAACGPEDYTDVRAEVTMAGPPLQRTLGGATSSSGLVRVDEYRFRVRMIAEGHSRLGRMARYRHDATLLVEVEVGPN